MDLFRILFLSCFLSEHNLLIVAEEIILGDSRSLKLKIHSRMDHRAENMDEDVNDDVFSDGEDADMEATSSTRYAEEIPNLLDALRVDENEEVLINACRLLTSIVKEFPEQKQELTAKSGIVPLLDVVDESTSEKVVEAVYRLLVEVFRVSFYDSRTNGLSLSRLPPPPLFSSLVSPFFFFSSSRFFLYDEFDVCILSRP